MVTANPIREQLTQELHQIPDGKLAAILDLVHYFRVGVQMEQRGGVNIQPLPVTTDEQLLDELRAFIRRPNSAALGEFRLNLEGYRFDREEANERCENRDRQHLSVRSDKYNRLTRRMSCASKASHDLSF